MDEAVLLSALRIEEVSGVDAPATGISGWMVAKRSERNLTAALAPAQPARKLHIAWGDDDGDVLCAVTRENEDWVSVWKRDGTRTTILKSALDPAERAAEVSSSTSAPSVVKHHADPQMRDEAGRFRESRWRKAQPSKLEGARFFT